jgi:serine phosphatase RsbU (regulator of sigma subunit)
MAELEFLNELARVVASNTELQPVLDWIVQKTTTMLSADEGAIRLMETEGDTQVLKTRYRSSKDQPGMTSGSWPQNLSQNVMGFITHFDEPLATPDLNSDARFSGLKLEDSRFRSVLAVPLKVDNRFTGMLAVTQAEPGRRWKQDEIQLLSIVAASSAGVLEQARLRVVEEKNRELEARRKVMDQELNIAREIQMNLLPRESLRAGEWEVCGRVLPAREVGGDAFDFFPLGDERLALAIADVSGKGVPAAILMSGVQGSLRAYCNGRGTISESIGQVNRGVVRNATGRFVTLFYAEFDSRSRALRYSNAGHNYPLVRRRDGTLVELVEGGLPLGIMEDAAYEEGSITLEPGDSLLLYSDGLTEALDAFARMFGEERLREVWQRMGGGNPTTCVEALLAEVQTFRGGAVQSDDMTLVVLGAHAVP